MTEGVCMPGHLRCVRGREVCDGEVPLGREVCDCEDDDCDGATDENPDSGSLCPTGTICLDCACARPCADSEFAPCPTGRVPQVGSDGACFCVTPRCNATTCAGETNSNDAGEVVCAPGMDGVPTCTCRNNECTFPCDGVICTGLTVCHPSTGICVANDCRALGCPTGQICDRIAVECVDDPCADAGCAVEQACRSGTCETSCARAVCEHGERCASGECVDDPCADTRCATGAACDPSTGACVPDRCERISCMAGEICQPVTGECQRDRCLDLRCPASEFCRAGECVGIDMPMRDAGPVPDAGKLEDGTVRVLATGGGGCFCAAVGASSETSPQWAFALLGALGLLIATRRRGR
jgi:hypothetical protein